MSEIYNKLKNNIEKINHILSNYPIIEERFIKDTEWNAPIDCELEIKGRPTGDYRRSGFGQSVGYTFGVDFFYHKSIIDGIIDEIENAYILMFEGRILNKRDSIPTYSVGVRKKKEEGNRWDSGFEGYDSFEFLKLTVKKNTVYDINLSRFRNFLFNTEYYLGSNYNESENGEFLYLSEPKIYDYRTGHEYKASEFSNVNSDLAMSKTYELIGKDLKLIFDRKAFATKYYPEEGREEFLPDVLFRIEKIDVINNDLLFGNKKLRASIKIIAILKEGEKASEGFISLKYDISNNKIKIEADKYT